MVVLAGCSGGGGSISAGSKSKHTLTTKPLTIPPLPAGWKVVKNYEIGIDVPNDWTVKKWQPTCGVTSPTVFLGPEGLAPKCPNGVATGGLVFHGAFAYSGSQKPKIVFINGMEATEVVTQNPSHGTPSGTVTTIWVRLLSGTPDGLPYALFVLAGETAAFPGGGPGMAQKIVSTIHNTLA